jgi:hypothetical protein
MDKTQEELVDIKCKLTNLCDMLNLAISMIGHDRELILIMSDALKRVSDDNLTDENKVLAKDALKLSYEIMIRHDQIIMEIASMFEPVERGH